MGFAVVIDRVAGAGDDNFHIDRLDCHIAVRYNEGYFSKVAVRILKLISGKSHFSRSGVGLLCLCRTAEREVGFGIQRVAEFHIISFSAVSLTVIVDSIVMTGNGNENINGINGHITVGDLKGDSIKVSVCILEVFCGKSHFGRTGVGSHSLGATVINEVFIDVVQFRIRCCVITVCAVRLTVIIYCIVMTGDGNSDIDRIDRDISVNDRKCYVFKVAVGILELIRAESHHCSTGVCSLRLCRTAEREVGFGVQRSTVCDNIAGNGM